MPVPYQKWTEVPDGAVLRDAAGDIAARSGDRWQWWRLSDRWGEKPLPYALDAFDDLAARPPVEEIGRLAEVTQDHVRALVAAVEGRPGLRPGAEVERWADLPDGAVVADRMGDIAHRWEQGRRRWPRVDGRWRDSPDAHTSAMAPYRLIGFAFGATADVAGPLRRMVEAFEAEAKGAAAVAPEVKVGDEVPATEVGWRRSRSEGRIVALGTQAPQEVAAAVRAAIAAGASASAAVKIGDKVPPTEAAWAALPAGTLVRLAQGEVDSVVRAGATLGEHRYYREDGTPGRPGAARPWKVGAPAGEVVALGVGQAAGEVAAALAGARPPAVGDEVDRAALERLPVGAVVDTRDGSIAPLAVRGPCGWGWGVPRDGGSPQWRGSLSVGLVLRGARSARYVAQVAEGLRGDAFDRALAEQGYQPAIDALAGRAKAGGKPTPIERWTDIPVGGIARDPVGDILVREDAGHCRWAREGALWWEAGPFSPEGEPHPGKVLIAQVADPKDRAAVQAAVEAFERAECSAAAAAARLPAELDPALRGCDLALAARERRRAWPKSNPRVGDRVRLATMPPGSAAIDATEADSVVRRVWIRWPDGRWAVSDVPNSDQPAVLRLHGKDELELIVTGLTANECARVGRPSTFRASEERARSIAQRRAGDAAR